MKSSDVVLMAVDLDIPDIRWLVLSLSSLPLGAPVVTDSNMFLLNPKKNLVVFVFGWSDGSYVGCFVLCQPTSVKSFKCYFVLWLSSVLGQV